MMRSSEESQTFAKFYQHVTKFAEGGSPATGPIRGNRDQCQLDLTRMMLNSIGCLFAFSLQCLDTCQSWQRGETQTKFTNIVVLEQLEGSSEIPKKSRTLSTPEEAYSWAG